ncbi:MAG: hypothetical protein ACYC77_10685 [Coriobacteriia bacterium]
MAILSGSTLLHEVAKRVLARYLKDKGYSGVEIARGMLDGAEAVDLTYSSAGKRLGVKVKADPYYGLDPEKTSRRDLTYYRPQSESYGLESISDTFTRQPGWVQRSRADELYYYRLVLDQPEDEVAALMGEPDDVFFAEIRIERDDLRILPMRSLREWFEATGDRYTPRPVMTDGRSAWYRIIPDVDVERGVAGVRRVGSVFSALVRK